MLRPALAAACLAALLASAAPARAASPAPEIQIAELPAPSAAGSSGGSLTTAPDGTVWLTWLEPAAGGTTALRCSTLDAAAKKWRAPHTIAAGTGWMVNWADFPALTAGADGRATAVWPVSNPEPPAAPGPAATGHGHDGPGYRAFFSSTADGGKTWGTPAPLTRESDSVEFVSLATLADGRVLAAWLDGRAKKSGGHTTQQLYARVLGETSATATAPRPPDTLLDASVCDCCQTTLTAFPDGGALLAYRGRTAAEVRDIRTARFDGREWEEPRPLGADDWHIAGCPVNGPQLASDGGRVAAAWFTAADSTPRVLASFSPDAGARFLMPLRVDRGHPAGRADTLLLHDGALLVTWLENDEAKSHTPGGLWLRRVTPDFTADEPVLLTPLPAARASGFARTALVRDYAGSESTAELAVVFTAAENNTTALHTLFVTVPEGALLAARDNSCHCAPTPEQLQGFPIRGTIAAVRPAPEQDTLRLRHAALPGVLPAGTDEFRAAPAVLAAVRAGRECLARIERRAGDWWIFDVRLLVVPAGKN